MSSSEFCHYFLTKHEGYLVSPLRLSGSAIESVFGQFKFNVGGKLDAANYRVARAAFLMKQASEGHHSGKGYRDAPLSVRDVTLERKSTRVNKYNYFDFGLILTCCDNKLSLKFCPASVAFPFSVASLCL